jgi:hypothetical protein
MINEEEPQTDGRQIDEYRQILNVYRISRSNGIRLKQIHLPLSLIGHTILLLELRVGTGYLCWTSGRVGPECKILVSASASERERAGASSSLARPKI